LKPKELGELLSAESRGTAVLTLAAGSLA